MVSDYYNRSPRIDPLGPTSGSGRVIRGGDFSHGAQYLRSAYRSSFSPGAIATSSLACAFSGLVALDLFYPFTLGRAQGV